MAATVNTQYWNGATATMTNASQVRFRTDDSPGTIDLTNSILIPSSGLHYSYWLHLGLAWTGIGDQINNIQFYSDGNIGWNLGTAGKVVVGLKSSAPHGVNTTDYTQASGTEGTTGIVLNSTNYTALANTTNIVNYTSGNTLIVDTFNYTTDTHSKAVVLQVVVDTDATQGQQTTEQLTFQWDEI